MLYSGRAGELRLGKALVGIVEFFIEGGIDFAQGVDVARLDADAVFDEVGDEVFTVDEGDTDGGAGIGGGGAGFWGEVGAGNKNAVAPAERTDELLDFGVLHVVTRVVVFGLNEDNVEPEGVAVNDAVDAAIVRAGRGFVAAAEPHFNDEAVDQLFESTWRHVADHAAQGFLQFFVGLELCIAEGVLCGLYGLGEGGFGFFFEREFLEGEKAFVWAAEGALRVVFDIEVKCGTKGTPWRFAVGLEVFAVRGEAGGAPHIADGEGALGLAEAGLGVGKIFVHGGFTG